MVKKLFLLTAITFGSCYAVNAQVGIGNSMPNVGSILDLTNSSNKALLLPIASQDPSTIGTFNIPASAGMLFYYQDKLFLRTSTGINVLSPWFFDGTTSNGIYVASGTPVGIGIAPIASSPAVLTIADITGDVNLTSDVASLVIGDNDFTTPHLAFDKNEIMAKTSGGMAGVPGILKLQEEGGTVEIRATTADAGVVTVLTAYGSMDAKGKMKENGNDLLPVGSIIMWNGTTVPAGWALCDGGSYALMDGSGNVTAPNLMDRFIYGADATGGTGVAVGTYTSGSGSSGGGVTHSLTVANLPGHQHEAGSNSATMNITSSGAHSHTTQATYLVDNDDNDDTSCAMGTSCGTDASGTQATTATVTSTGSDHTHPNGNFSGFTGLGNGLSGSTITHGLPPFFALAFIMKL